MCNGCPKCDRGVVPEPKRCVRPSTVDDHIVPLAEGGTDDRANHRGICSPCSDHKTAQEAARGNARKPRARRPAEPHPGWNL